MSEKWKTEEKGEGEMGEMWTEKRGQKGEMESKKGMIKVKEGKELKERKIVKIVKRSRLVRQSVK